MQLSQVVFLDYNDTISHFLWNDSKHFAISHGVQWPQSLNIFSFTSETQTKNFLDGALF